MIARRRISDGWTVTCATGEVPPVAATVPGCVHTDLLRAGLIPDPCADDNELAVAWIGQTDWVYQTEFEYDAERRQPETDLTCDGLDTIAEVSVNGVVVGQTANMHRRFRFGVGELLRPGSNTVAVRFTSAYRYAERIADLLGERPSSYPQPFNLIRKMACNFGWDWGPTLVGAGIWQPIALESWRTARLAEVRPVVTVQDGTGRVRLHVTVERAGFADAVHLEAHIAGVNIRVTVEAGATEAELELTVADPDLWWPRGYGAQPLYETTLTLSDGTGAPLDHWRRRLGFRTVRLDTSPDPTGSAFTVIVNDVPIFVKGVNWIPDDVYPANVTRERYAHRLAQACAANINYLRVWGGGRYESDDFYEIADELGLMVGQDFLFACAAYPEEEPLHAEVLAEAEQQIVRLASHASLVLWNGNNENVWGYYDWDWQPKLAGRTWGAGYYFDLLPALLARLDPTRPYWPSSPYSGRDDIHPNEPNHGTMHIWDVWNQVDYLHYRDYVPRFAGEYGYQAPPTYATLRRALSDQPLAADSPGMRHHQKAIDGDLKLQRGLDAHLPVPGDFDDWLYLTQVNQARAVTVAIEHFRSHRPTCMGSVVWQLNDCWPSTSWSAIDSDGRAKPLWYALRRSYRDRLLTIQPYGDRLVLVAINDCADGWSTSVEVTRYSLTGQPLAKHAVAVAVPARDVACMPLPLEVSMATSPTSELVRANVDEYDAWWFFAEDRAMDYPAARFTTATQRVADGVRLTVTAQTILRDLTVFPDRLDPYADVDTALVTLLPGESTTFLISGIAPDVDESELVCRPVLRCVNDLS